MFSHIWLCWHCVEAFLKFSLKQISRVQIQEQVFRDSLLIWFLLALLAPKLQLHTLAVSLLPSCGKNRRQQELKKNEPSTASKLNKYRKRQQRSDSVCALFSKRSQKDKEEVWLQHSSANWTEMGAHKEKPQLQTTFMKAFKEILYQYNCPQ